MVSDSASHPSHPILIPDAKVNLAQGGTTEDAYYLSVIFLPDERVREYILGSQRPVRCHLSSLRRRGCNSFRGKRTSGELLGRLGVVCVVGVVQ